MPPRKVRVVSDAPRLVRKPLVVLVRHAGHGLHVRLRDRKEKAVSLLRDLQPFDWDYDALLCWGEKAARSHNGIVSAVLRSKNDISYFPNDFVVGTSYLGPDDLIGSQARTELID